MKAYTLAEVQDSLIGKVGTPDRDKFDYELQMELAEKANMATTSKIKTISLDEMKDEFIGKRGTDEREKYEYKLNMEVFARMIGMIK